MLRIRDVYPGSRIRLFSIPDPNCLHPGSRIRLFSIPDPGSELSPSRIPDPGPASKTLKYFNPKKTKKIGSKL